MESTPRQAVIGDFEPGQHVTFTKTFTGDDVQRFIDIRFLRPVHVGDTVTAHFVVRAVDRERHRLEIDSWMENEAGERVLEGECEAGLMRTPSS